MSMGFDDNAYDDLLTSATVSEATDSDMPWLASLRGGGSSDNGAGAGATVDVAAEPEVDTPPVEVEEEDSRAVSPQAHSAPPPETPASLQKTDHQEAVQAAASATGTRGGDAGSDEGGSLPRSGFRVLSDQAQPIFKNVPDVLVTQMRSQLEAIIVRELGLSEGEAKLFCERLSQGALTTAFLMAHLDVRVDVDPATERAAVLFRRHDSLLGTVAQRVERLQESATIQRDLLSKAVDALRETRRADAVLEQGVSWLLAERVEHLGKSISSAANLPLGHKSAVEARDKLRDATAKLERLEREREGRAHR